MQQYIVDSLCPSQVVNPNKVNRKVKSYNENLMVVDVDFENGAIGPVHTHIHEQISYCIHGEFNYSIEDTCYNLKAGDTILVPANHAHGCVLMSPKGKLLDIFTPYRADFV